MKRDIVLDKIENVASLLYQNREEEGIKAVTELLQWFQLQIQNLTEEQKNEGGAFALLMLKELLECYQSQDVLGMADCLMEKSVLFVEYISE